MGADHAGIFAEAGPTAYMKPESIGQTVAMRRFAAVLVVGVIALAACGSSGSKASPTSAGGSTAAPANGEPQGTKTYTGLERTHVDTPVDYPQTPPVGGPHNPVWQTCAFFDKPIMKERGVHSMEHGAVWITYTSTLSSDDIDLLKKAQQAGPKVLVSPFPGLPSPIVASAWGKQLLLQSASDPRLLQFVKYFSDGPQTPEPGVPCTGGTMET
jgi:hypothetical protein